MSFAKDGNSDIYTMDLENRIVEKITNHPSIDTSPSYSPDGKYVVLILTKWIPTNLYWRVMEVM